jgi:3-hydroxyisobutyrate dehydrogenase-like beta-hydroxyacid dehydrogenase
MKTIGFVGLGIMGAPMAASLLKGGFEVAAYDLRSEAVEAIAERGGLRARQLEDLTPCDAVVVMVNTDAQARAVIGPLIPLLREHPRPIVSMSTILPSTIRELGRSASLAGVGMLDAPVSGGPIVAQMARLAIMVGGDRALFDEVKPLLQAMGESITHVGPLGAGLTLKLVNNMIAINALPIVLQAFRIGLAQGLDLSTMVEVIKASSGNTWVTDQWEQARMLLSFVLEDVPELDSLWKTGLKDMELATELCAQAGIDAPLLRHASNGLKEHGLEGLRESLTKVMQAAQTD